MKTNSSPPAETDGAAELKLHGIKVSPGIAIGPAYVISQLGIAVPEYVIPESKVEDEIKRFQATIAKTHKQLGQLKQKTEALPVKAQEEMTALLEAYKAMINGSRLVRGVEEQIRAKRINAEAAIQKQATDIAAGFASMKDPYLASRANDVRHIGSRLIRNIMQQQYNPFAAAPPHSILIAEEITPADTALMDPDRIGGFAAVLGGAEGHTAIMARALRLPAALGVAGLLQNIDTGDMVIVDGGKGDVVVRPSPQTLQNYRQEAARIAREDRKLRSLDQVPAITADGMPIMLHANIELPRETPIAIQTGAEGVGLLRTEFMFMNRSDMPGEDEQFESLRGIIKQMEGKPLTVRTLDIGGEKLAAASGLLTDSCTNPALGLRAIRLGLRETKILDTQLAAILRAAAYGPVRILIPMVSSTAQMIEVRERLDQVERKLRRRGVKLPAARPPLGAMIEVPAAALIADALTKVCDFFAIGSNDLTQYTLAIDRCDDRVADLYNPFHPAILRLIQFTIAAGWRANIPVSLCGEMAGDPRATALLLGLKLRTFSVAPSRLPLIKQTVRAISMTKAIHLAESVMSTNSEAEIAEILDKGPDMAVSAPALKRPRR